MPVQFRVSPADGLVLETAVARLTLSWSACIHYVESDELILLHQPNRLAMVVPKRALPGGELARFRELLDTRLPRSRAGRPASASRG